VISVNPVLKKLFYKNQEPVLLLQAPPEFKKTSAAFSGKIHSKPTGLYPFVLAFVKSLAEAEKSAKLIQKSLSPDSIFWMAYPKGTSKKYKSDYNRDTGYALMEKLGFTGVSLVALDEDWSAMRFKQQSKK
jgi:hypothetical protein